MASPQNAYVNSLPLLQPDLNGDPELNELIAPGAALIALDPNDPSAAQPPVGQAMDAVAGQDEEPMDDVAARMANGGKIRITNQTQFDALSPHQKSVVRAAVAAGGTLRATDALKIYQDSVKQARATQVQTITTSDGRTVDMVNNQLIYPEKPQDAVKRELRETEDGLRSIDPSTGESFQVYDKYSGGSVRGPAKLSATQEDNIKRLQMQSESLGARLDQLARYTETDKVQYDDQTGAYASAPWMGAKVKDLRTQLEKEKGEYDKRVETALRPVRRDQAAQQQADPAPTPLPTSTPEPTPRPNPMPTPTPAGNISKAAYDALAPGESFTWNGKTYTKK